MRKTSISIPCEQCGNPRKTYQYELKNKKGLFCSRECADKARLGKMPPNYQGLFFTCLNCKRVRPINQYKLDHGQGKFCINRCKYEFFKGKHFGINTEFKKGEKRISGENSYSWKKTGIKYRGIHYWVESLCGKANKCEYKGCVYPRVSSWGKLVLHPKRYDWANISHEYKRDLSDWIQLCPSCHKLYDLGKIDL